LFHEHLEKHHITLSNLNIEYLDQFMTQFKVSQNTLSPTSPVSNEIQKDMVIFRGMSFVGC
jgi:hypothetical protein